MTVQTTAPPDRRTVLKARRRRAVLDAAAALIEEHHGPQFSVDELAARAQVARRTVFNYFESLDDVVLTVCTERLNRVIHEVQAVASATPVGDGSRASMFEELAATLRGADLPSAITFLAKALGSLADGDPRAEALAQGTFSRVSEEMSRELMRRHPDADLLEVRLLLASMVHGVAVIALDWVSTPVADGLGSPAAREAWNTLVDRLIHSVRAGYMPEH